MQHMYTLNFEVNGKKIEKKAHNEKEVKRLIYVYAVGSQTEKQALIDDVLQSKEIQSLNKFK